MNCNKTIYTPGPTNLRDNVRRARALKTTNPDVDLDFVEFYKETCDRFGEIINTKNDCYILSFFFYYMLHMYNHKLFLELNHILT